jgi:hypothetical protein
MLLVVIDVSPMFYVSAAARAGTKAPDGMSQAIFTA